MLSPTSTLAISPRWITQAHGGTRRQGLKVTDQDMSSWWAAAHCYQQGDPLATHARLLVFTQHLDASLHIGLLGALRPHFTDAFTTVIDDIRLRRMGVHAVEKMVTALKATHLLLYRYWGLDLDEVLRTAAKLGVPTVGFLDDNLLSLPEDHAPANLAYFSKPDNRLRIKRLIQKTNVMVASTPTLARQLSKLRHGEPVRALSSPCSLPGAAAMPPGKIRERGKTIGYMASASHRTDFELVAPGLSWLMERRPEIDIEIFGTVAVPASLQTFGDRVRLRRKTHDYPSFLSSLKELHWDVGLAPLQRNEFNAGKTPIKWLEYTHAGIPTLTTPGPVYQCPLKYGACAVAYPWRFGRTLMEILDNPELRSVQVQRASALARNQFDSEAHGQQWLALLDEIKQP